MDSFVDEMANAMVALTTPIVAAAQNPPNPPAVTQNPPDPIAMTQNPPKKRKANPTV
jgi:hypothetical protein